MEEFQMEKPKDSKTAVWIILIVLVGLIALAAGYLIGRGVKAKAPAAPVAETAVIETNATATLAATSPAVSATTTTAISNWKTYTNDTYGYSFKYPSDWVVKDLTQSNSHITGLQSLIVATTGEKAGDSWFQVQVKNTSLSDELTKVTSAKEEVQKFGTTATAVTSTNSTTGFSSTAYYVAKNPSVFIINGDGTDTDATARIGYEIFSTFQFTK